MSSGVATLMMISFFSNVFQEKMFNKNDQMMLQAFAEQCPGHYSVCQQLLYGLNARAPGGSGSPGHQTGVRKELISSKGVVRSSSRSK